MRCKTHTSPQQPVPSERDVPVVRSKDSVRQNRLLFWMKAHNLIEAKEGFGVRIFRHKTRH
jgi:hypothetical protein